MKNRPRPRIIIILLSHLMALSIAGSLPAQQDGEPVVIGSYRTLDSRVLGEERTLLVNLPGGYEETAIAYPVLYLLYGGQVRGYFAEAVHIVDRLQEAGLIPRMIIVGVKNVDRYRDNLPVGRRGEEGGAANFLRFFTEELIPFIDASYRTKDFRLLVGPQAGASFGLYALMESPALFSVNIITNPFWNQSVREYLLRRSEEFFHLDEPLESFFFIRSGTSDDNEATLEYLEKLVAAVEEGGRPGFTLILDKPSQGEADRAVPPPGLREGLNAFFKDYSLPEDVEVNGLEDIEAYYSALSLDYGYEVGIPERVLIMEADELQRKMRTDEAREIYEHVVSQYPHNLDSYIRLAEMHRRLGDYDRSIEYYEKFLTRRPEPMIQSRLDELRRYVRQSAAYAVRRAVLISGIEAGIARFRELEADNEGWFYFDEAEFNSLGYGLIGREMVEAAIEIFKINVEMNPESANAYDSLGEAYMLKGDRAAAIENYTRSLELDPGNANASEMLGKLKDGGE
jgi:predicted alpha/beta superfamily hydrolase